MLSTSLLHRWQNDKIFNLDRNNIPKVKFQTFKKNHSWHLVYVYLVITFLQFDTKNRCIYIEVLHDLEVTNY